MKILHQFVVTQMGNWIINLQIVLYENYQSSSSFMIMVLAATMSVAFAQAPTEMQYQVMVVNPSTGQPRANEAVAVSIEIRQAQADGEAVWKKDYLMNSNKMGVCNVNLDFTDATFDWAQGPYFIATLIDGNESGVTKLTSVPYALCASKAVDADKLGGENADWYRDKIEMNRAYVDMLNDKTSNIQAQVDDNLKILVDYNNELANATVRIQRLQIMIEELQKMINELQAMVYENKERISTNSSRIDSVEATVKELESK